MSFPPESSSSLEEELKMKELYSKNRRQIMSWIFSAYRSWIRTAANGIQELSLIRQCLVIHLEMLHLDENVIRGVRSLQEIRDYKTLFPNVIPVRLQEKIDHHFAMRKAEQNDIDYILSGKPLKDHRFETCVIEDSLALVMSEVFPVSTYGWSVFELLKTNLLNMEIPSILRSKF